jgi:NAD(P)-dependent dehydrogenase (short-subunit alcohol dehydrogenase family)
MDLGLAEKVALVAGGSAGIGRAVARVLAAEGAHVAICGRSVDGLRDAEQEIKGLVDVDILPVQADFSRREDIERFFQEAVDHFGGVDIFVNSVGQSMFGSFEQVSDERWVEDINLKLFGAVRACRAVIPHLRERGGGCIVNVAGNSGKQPYMWHYPGGAANAALLHFSHALAQELCSDNIRVTAVCPGPVETRRLRKQLGALAELWGMELDEAETQFYESQPMGRAATAEEVGNLVAFLVSDKAEYISGTYVTIDGCITQCI